MQIGERLLFFLVKRLYRPEACRSQQSREADQGVEADNAYPVAKMRLILDAAERYGVSIRGRTVLDFGCGDGSITPLYPRHGASAVIGVDVKAETIAQAREKHPGPRVQYLQSGATTIPLDDQSVETIISYDVLEHVNRPTVVLGELHRVLRPGGKALIGTWGWYHPYAPHFFATMPVPWAHVFFSEKTIMRTCRRVYLAPWYVPAHYDLDDQGTRKPRKYLQDHISTDYVNKLLIHDYERIFRASPFYFRMYPRGFSSPWARWSWIFLRLPWVKEFVTAYLWVVLTKKRSAPR